MRASMRVGLCAVARAFSAAVQRRPLHRIGVQAQPAPRPREIPAGHREAMPAADSANDDTMESSDDLLYGCRVLLVDGEPAIRHALQVLLFRWHCDARVVANAAEALALVAQQHARHGGRHSEGSWTPELVLSGYRLPGNGSGIDAVQDVRRAMGRQVAAVLISGDTTPEQAQLAARHGLTLACKPVTSSVLRDKMVQALLRRP
ncbi:response regulator [Variovorax terrae]|uniref:Response regulatory domain-containing protein n=1 Tax=Variovorax terrae TaxID=2923278 RepID=A0A9X2AQX8_9BURK|nr:hypothetical protein [Variovorax terrae]MCJ0763641.1 hypothetical protein [Variovorax terrae]